MSTTAIGTVKYAVERKGDELEREELKTTAEMIEVMQAFERGEKIEYFSSFAEKWAHTESPKWDWAYSNYRIAQKTKLSLNWDHVLKNCNWLARDINKKVYVYEQKPVLGDGFWIVSEGLFFPADCLASLVKGDCDWQDSLVERPQQPSSPIW